MTPVDSPTVIESLVTTIIPVYNRAGMVRQAVDSVLAQTYRPIEIILVDDGSTDETPAVLDAMAREHPDEIRVLHKVNEGPGLAREAGRQIARGEFIQYLDSDDWLLPNKFADQVRALREHPECGIAYGTSMLVDARGRGDQRGEPLDRSRVRLPVPGVAGDVVGGIPIRPYSGGVCRMLPDPGPANGRRIGIWRPAWARCEHAWCTAAAPSPANVCIPVLSGCPSGGGTPTSATRPGSCRVFINARWRPVCPNTVRRCSGLRAGRSSSRAIWGRSGLRRKPGR